MISYPMQEKEVAQFVHPCECAACQHGCSMGSGTLGNGDKEKIAEFLNIPVAELEQQHLEEIEKFNTKRLRPKIERNGKPYGKCTFFKKGKCAIHEVKPLECKMAMPCSPQGDKLIAWFTLRHFLNKEDPESIRQYASYLKMGGISLPGASVEEIVPDKNKREKILTYSNGVK